MTGNPKVQSVLLDHKFPWKEHHPAKVTCMLTAEHSCMRNKTCQNPVVSNFGCVGLTRNKQTKLPIYKQIIPHVSNDNEIDSLAQ